MERPDKVFAVEDSQFRIAGVVAAVFKVAAWLVLAVGLYAIFWVRGHFAVDSWREQFAIAGGAVFVASSLAFFAYVLELLRALVLDSRRKD